MSSGRFDVIECSVNVFDRASLDGPVAAAVRRSLDDAWKMHASPAWRGGV